MIGLVVTGHGHFADGIHTSAQMIAGENDYVRYINFEEGMTPEQLAEKFNAAFDEFKSCDGVVVLSDLPGGSTLGSIANTQVSLNTVDIGLAQLAMHSCFETAGAADTAYMVRALQAFFGMTLEVSADGTYQMK